MQKNRTKICVYAKKAVHLQADLCTHAQKLCIKV